MLAGGRVPHALLFAGPEGVGKKHFALELACAFVCQTPEGGEACGDCVSCRRAGEFELPTSEKGDDYKRVFLSGHPDIGMVIPFRKNLYVDTIRDLEREANFRPFEAQERFFVIDDADKMNDAASNALLKTLEEPSETTYLILVSSRPDSLLQTIRSRCQIVRFAPIPVATIEEHLVSTGKFSPEDAAVAARVSGGSVGKALNIDLQWFREIREASINLLRSALVTGDISSMLRTSEQINDAKNKDRFEDAIEVLQMLVRDVFALGNGAEKSSISNADIADDLAELAGAAKNGRLAQWTTEIEELLAGLNVNLNRKIATDALFVSMAA